MQHYLPYFPFAKGSCLLSKATPSMQYSPGGIQGFNQPCPECVCNGILSCLKWAEACGVARCHLFPPCSNIYLCKGTVNRTDMNTSNWQTDQPGQSRGLFTFHRTPGTYYIQQAELSEASLGGS